MIKEYIALEVMVEGDENHDLFVGTTESGYQLCGFRESSARSFISDREECGDRNYGTVYLPAGKTSFSELVEGDALLVQKDGKPTYFHGATYIRHL